MDDKLFKFIPKPDVNHIKINNMQEHMTPHYFVKDDDGQCKVCKVLKAANKENTILPREEHKRKRTLVMHIPGLTKYLYEARDALRFFKVSEVVIE